MFTRWVTIKNYKNDQEASRQAISIFLACGKHSFRIIEETWFKYLIGIESPNNKNIIRQRATRDTLHYYTKERENVKEELLKPPVEYA